MADPIPDLWPNDFVAPETLPPVAILREQAALLGKKTQNLVEAEVKGFVETSNRNNVRYHFNLVAPAMGNYRYRLLYVTHDVAMFYPLEIHADVLGKQYKVNSREEFIEALRIILISGETKNVISTLLAQSTAQV